MKKLFITTFSILFTLSIIAQAPYKMSFQAVIRNASNNLIVSQTVGMRISILQGSSSGTAVYVETQTPMTNTNGLATIEIGSGTVVSGSFASINWAAGPYFIKTETDPTGGTTYSITGTSELLSVPYALSSADNKWTSTGTNISNNNTGNIGIGITTPNPTAYGYSGINKVIEMSSTVPNSHSQLVISSDISNIGNTGGMTFVNKTAPVSEKRMAAITSQYNDATLDYDGDGVNELGGSIDFWTNKDGIYNQKMKITIDGDVGIGTTSPSAKLDVSGKTRTSDLQVTNGAGVGKVLTSDASGNASWHNNNTWNLNGNNGTTSSNFIGTTDSQSLLFKVNNNMSGIIDVSYQNTSFGIGALQNYSRPSNGYNSAFGNFALGSNDIGYNNTAIGQFALAFNTEGTHCTAIGTNAGAYNYMNHNNVFVGFESGLRSSGNNSIAIGMYSQFLASNQARIGVTTTASIGGYQDWTNLSDGRYKINIKENVPGLNFILKLKPVTYTIDIKKLNSDLGYTDSTFSMSDVKEAGDRIQTGFIAQDVEKIAKELGYTFSGVDAPQNENDHYGLRYAQFTVPLVKAVQEQQLQIELLQNQIVELKKLLLELTK